MSTIQSMTAADLIAWQRMRLNTVHCGRTDYGLGDERVTVLAYHWGASAEKTNSEFYRIEIAFRETWLYCGMVKSVIVTDKITPEMAQFAADFPMVEVQVEPRLVPGKIESMSEDCNARLYSRFNTPYVLVIQADGFPLRKGLEEFFGKWDFIGAPYVRKAWWRSLVCSVLGIWVSNGGFSLRSRRLCCYAAEKWKRYQKMHPSQSTVDDLYYTETLPLHNPLFRFRFKIAPIDVALRFSYDAIVPQPVKVLPFGFHRDKTFGMIDGLKRK